MHLLLLTSAPRATWQSFYYTSFTSVRFNLLHRPPISSLYVENIESSSCLLIGSFLNNFYGDYGFLFFSCSSSYMLLTSNYA